MTAGHLHAAAAPSLDLAAFVLLGLAGSFGHCAGMCAPFVMFVSRRFCEGEAASHSLASAQAWYHAGRLTTYMVLGGLAGALGGAVELAGRIAGVQRAALVLAGAVLVMTALSALIARLRFDVAAGVFARLAQPFGRRMPGHPLAAGLLLGLLPCGLLYSALVAAAARGGIAGGVTALACFGAGTAPALIGLSVAERLIAGRRAAINALAQVFILAMGAWFLWRGLVR